MEEEYMDNSEEMLEDSAEELEQEDVEEQDGEDKEEDEQSLEDLLEEAALDKKIKVKVDGEEKVMTVRELQKVKQLESASYKKMQEAAEAKKMAQQLFDLAKQNPRKFIELTGQDPYDFAEATLSEKLEMMGMSKEQREMLELKKENESLRERQQAFEREQQEKQKESEVKAEYDRLQREVSEAWQETGLPEDKLFSVSIAQTMIADRRQKQQEAIEMGLDPSQIPDAEYLTAKDAAAIVKQNWLNNVSQTFKQMDANTILEVLDKEVIRKIQQAQVNRVSSKTSAKFSKPSPGNRPASTRKREHNTEEAYNEWLRSLTS